ncbi:MAG: 6-bladed beta-propeller [Candidatus Polarisedimenticolaceae bacterium]|nr:6-bladed beta-propeller [Candidatus Polarisedimenticolaceae bacterium]
MQRCKGVFSVMSWAVISVCALTLVGCSSGPAKKEVVDLFWPAPPEQPRIRYIDSYSGQADFSDTTSFKAALLGIDQKGLQLLKPYGVTTSRDGKLMYVTDTKLHALVVFDFEKKSVYPFPTDAMGGLTTPLEVRIDSQERIFVTDSAAGRVNIYSKEGKTLLTLGDGEGLQRPTGLVIDEKNNRFYVSDTPSHRILIYTLDGEFIDEMGERGSAPGELNFPISLALDKESNLYVVDSGNFRIQVFSPEGEFIRSVGKLGDSYGSLARPKGIALDSEENLYALDAAFNNYQIFNKEGKLMLFIGALGRRPGMFWLPTGIFIDAKDKIYVADSINARIQIFQYLKDGVEAEAGEAAEGKSAEGKSAEGK